MSSGSVWLDLFLSCVALPMLGLLVVGVGIELWERRR